jgi:hypothetical protein
MLLYFLKIDFFFLPFIYSPVKKREATREKSKERRAKSDDDVPSLRVQDLRAQHLRLAERAHIAHC